MEHNVNTTARLFKGCIMLVKSRTDKDNQMDIRDFVLGYTKELKKDSCFDEYITQIENRASNNAKCMDNDAKCDESKLLSLNHLKKRFLNRSASISSSENYDLISQKKMMAYLLVLEACIDLLSPPSDVHSKVESQAKHKNRIQTGKYMLTFVISAKETDVINNLKSQNQLTPENFLSLFKSREWIHYAPEHQWDRTCGDLFEGRTQKLDEDDHDVYYVAIKMNAHNDRFEKISSLSKLYDALSELAKQKPALMISDRHPKESYENKGFFQI